MSIAVATYVILNPVLSYAARYALSADGCVHIRSASLYTMVHMLVSVCLALCDGTRHKFSWRLRPTTAASLVALGVLEALSIVSNNIALGVTSVFTNQSIKSLTPLLLLLLHTRRFRLVHLSVFFAVVAICGLIESAHGDGTVTSGAWLSLFSMLCVVARMRMAQLLLHDAGVARHVVLCYQSLFGCLTMAFVFATTLALGKRVELRPTPLIASVYIAATSVVAAMYNFASVVVAQRYSSLTVSMLATARQGMVLTASLLYEASPPSSMALLLTLQLIAATTWYALDGVADEARHIVRAFYGGLEEEGSNDAPPSPVAQARDRRRRCACALACVTAVFAIPSLYDAVRCNTHLPPSSHDAEPIRCKHTFDGTAEWELVVARFAEDNLEALLSAARLLGAPITFHQAIPDPGQLVPDEYVRLTRAIEVYAQREPECIRLRVHANIMDEIFGYLTFMTERYHSLPKHAIFIKGSFRDYTGNDNVLLDVARGLSHHAGTTSVRYAPLPTLVLDPATACHPAKMSAVVSSGVGRDVHLPAPTRCYLKNQFILSRDAIAAWPVTLYHTLLVRGATTNLGTSRHLYHGTVSARRSLAFLFEFGGSQMLWSGGGNDTLESTLCRLGNSTDFCQDMYHRFDWKYAERRHAFDASTFGL